MLIGQQHECLYRTGLRPLAGDSWGRAGLTALPYATCNADSYEYQLVLGPATTACAVGREAPACSAGVCATIASLAAPAQRGGRLGSR